MTYETAKDLAVTVDLCNQIIVGQIVFQEIGLPEEESSSRMLLKRKEYDPIITDEFEDILKRISK